MFSLTSASQNCSKFEDRTCFGFLGNPSSYTGGYTINSNITNFNFKLGNFFLTYVHLLHCEDFLYLMVLYDYYLQRLNEFFGRVLIEAPLQLSRAIFPSLQQCFCHSKNSVCLLTGKL